MTIREPIPGCLVSGGLLALGIGGPKVFGTACGPLLFQCRVGPKPFLAFELLPGQDIDGEWTLGYIEHDFSVALSLAAEKRFLTALFFLLLGFALPALFCDGLDLRCEISRLSFHKTSPSGGRTRLSALEASEREHFANGRNFFYFPIRKMLCLARGAEKRPAAGRNFPFGWRRIAWYSKATRHLTGGA